MAAFRRWMVGDGSFGRWTIVPRGHAGPDEHERALPPRAAEWAVDRLFARPDALELHTLLELADVAPFDARHHSPERLRALIKQRVGPGGPLMVLDDRGRPAVVVRSAAAPSPAAPEAAGPPPGAKRDISLRFLEAGTGRPVAGAPLRITAPDGSEARLTTSSAGTVTLTGLEPGRCVATSVIQNAIAAASFDPSTTVPLPPSEARGNPAPIQRGWLVQAETHRVRTGDTPESIARDTGVPWNDLARFNWDTIDPSEIQRALRERVGCTKKTPDGRRTLFDDRDEPGVILVPRPWTDSFAVGMAHTLVVAPLRSITLSLENELGVPIPGAAYEIALADGSRRRGRLGRSGIARVPGVPEGPFSVAYLDQAELLARSLAASTRRAFDQQATGPLLHLLGQEQAIVDQAVGFYEEYFDDLTGRGLAADIDQVVTDPDARAPIAFLCRLAGLPVGALP
jgi:LysM domain-containing protein